MDYRGFFLGLAPAAAHLVGWLATFADFRRGRPRRWVGLGLVALSLAATASLGASLHHVYWLDERLFIAAAEGDVASVEALLAAGACPDATWEDGTAAIAAARCAGHDDVVAVLRRARAVEQGDVLGRCP